jgi:lipoate-protein ligase A
LTWRLLNTGQNNAAINMAIDEAIFVAQKASFQPTLRFYDWLQPAFSFGYFQQITHEVDVAACASHGIELVRRMTGGGTVIHGWDVTYTVIAPHGSGVLPKDISAAYHVISDCLINGLQRLSVDAGRQIEKPGAESRDNPSGVALPNICLTNPAQYDIMLNGNKIAGVSQRRNQIGAMYQGYIALDMPPPDVLALASKRFSRDQVMAGKSTAINLGRSTPIYRKQLEDAVAAGFEETFSIRLVKGERFPKEIEATKSLVQTKYATAEWNFRR